MTYRAAPFLRRLGIASLCASARVFVGDAEEDMVGGAKKRSHLVRAAE